MKFSYDKLVSLIFSGLLVWLSLHVCLTLFTLPSVENLVKKEVVVEDYRCSGNNTKSSLLLKVDIFEGSEFKLLKSIKNCSEELYGYLVGKKVIVSVTDSSKLSIWELRIGNKVLMSFKKVRSDVIKENISALIVGWGIFLGVFIIRKKKKRVS